MNNANNRSQLFSIITVLFFWGFIAASNGILIPFCKGHFNLTQFQSQLIDFTFYGGYFIGSVILYLYSKFTGIELLNRIGFQKGIVYGLIVSAIGSLSIIPSVLSGSYILILGSYFIIALGFSLQQTCAWPIIIALGSPETGAQRSNLAGSVFAIGTTIGPLILSFALFGSAEGNSAAVSLGSISYLYAGVTALFLLMAVFFSFAKLPLIRNEEHIEPGLGALKYPQLVLGMVAIFIYVGVEVTIQSNLGALLKLESFGSIVESELSPFISLYWGSLMIGRWMGSVAVFGVKGRANSFLKIFVPYFAYTIVLLVIFIHGKDASMLIPYVIPVALIIITHFLSGEKQTKMMVLFSLYGMLAMLVGLCTEGRIALFAFLSGGLACSVLWPCIFSLSIMGLGKYTSQGSAFLIMMILGGAIIPPLQGKLADLPSIGIHYSYFIPVLCFAYLAWFGMKVKSVLASQGIHSDGLVISGAH